MSSIQWTQSRLDELALWFVVQHSVTAYHGLTDFFGSAALALRATPAHWQQCGLHASHSKRLQQWQDDLLVRQQFDQGIASLNHPGDQVLSLGDSHFPRQLAQIADPPPFLFVRGSIEVLTQPHLAIVGSRKPSQSGRLIAQQFAEALACQGFCICSGLAHGIDAAAHTGALQAGSGQTVAVMGTGINLCYPSANQGLYQHIIECGGALVSEFFPNSPARDYHFPRRNRIVSGLSLGVLVVEAALKSGSLITAQTALDQNRQVFAIPGHIHNQQSRGCHQLIREGAILVDEPAQIIAELDLPRRWQQSELSTAQSVLPDAGMQTVDFGPEAMASPVMHSQATQGKAMQDTARQDTASQGKARQDKLTGADVRAVQPASPGMANPPVSLPEHLQSLFYVLDWVGQGIDSLVEQTSMDTATLTSQLMELEILGFAVQQGGLYQRCRQA